MKISIYKKENRKKNLIIANLIIGTLLISFLVLIISIIPSSESQSYDVCCEKTTSGAWCQNVPEEKCAAGFRKTPTSCDATSFCKPGCCYDSSDGLCMENTPQKVCDNKNGTWADSAECEIPQCKLGCCVLDNQAALVTLTRCKKLSGFYGVDTNFINNIQDEIQCIALTQLQDRGACVYEQDFTPMCKFTTRQECSSITGTGNTTISQFKKDYLCSAEELGSICGPTTETTCIPGKDEIYFVDSCGNPANIYDANRVNDKSYWSKIIDKSESCNANSANGNANSKSCGNCDYYLGSICKEAERTSRAQYGDNICKDLNCYDTSDGKDHKHGESWCSYDGNTGEGVDSVGSRHFRHLCIAGEELVEACDDYRNQVCIGSERETSSGKFSEAACRANRWTDCIAQDEQEDCENTDKRDCFWVEGISFPKEITETSTGTKTSAITGQAVFGGDDEKEESETQSGLRLGGGSCAPNVPPGLKFWEENSPECSAANTQCIVTFEKGLISGEKCKDNCECLDESWVEKMNQVCSALGDCGADVNWQGKFSDDGAEWKIDNKKQSISQGILNNIKKKAGV